MKTGFIGAGNMAEAIIKGMVKNGAKADSILIYDIDKEKTGRLSEACGALTVSSNHELAALSDIIVLAVKPHLIKTVLDEVKEPLNSAKHTLVSIAAGITLEMLEEFTGDSNMPTIRVMPNVNSAVLMGMSALCKNSFVSEEAYGYTKNMFEKIGKIAELDENFFPVFGALAGSSPAFAFLFIESMAKAAHKAGMPKAKALEIAAQAVLGSAALVLESGKHPWELIDSVCSPGGTTIEGICTLEREGFPAAVVNCLDNCMAKDKIIMERNK